MKLSLVLLSLSLSLSSFGAVVLSRDSKHGCLVYRATSADSPARNHESIVDDRSVYGFTLKNMQVDFENKVVSVETEKRIVLGFDRPLLNRRPSFHPLSKSQFQFSDQSVESQSLHLRQTVYHGSE